MAQELAIRNTQGGIMRTYNAQNPNGLDPRNENNENGEATMTQLDTSVNSAQAANQAETMTVPQRADYYRNDWKRGIDETLAALNTLPDEDVVAEGGNIAAMLRRPIARVHDIANRKLIAAQAEARKGAIAAIIAVPAVRDAMIASGDLIHQVKDGNDVYYFKGAAPTAKRTASTSTEPRRNMIHTFTYRGATYQGRNARTELGKLLGLTPRVLATTGQEFFDDRLFDALNVEHPTDRVEHTISQPN